MPGYGYRTRHERPGVPATRMDSQTTTRCRPPNTIWLTAEQRVDRDKAVFAQFDWDMTPYLMLTGGARQYWFDNSLVGFYGYSANFSSHTGESQCFPGAAGAPYVKNTPCTNLNTSTSDTASCRKSLTWKIALQR